MARAFAPKSTILKHVGSDDAEFFLTAKIAPDRLRHFLRSSDIWRPKKPRSRDGESGEGPLPPYRCFGLPGIKPENYESSRGNSGNYPVIRNQAAVGKAYITQFPWWLLIVDCWSYTFANWVYVVLSRVRTHDGLFLCRPLDLDKPFSTVPGPLLQFEQRMKVKEENFVAERAIAMANGN